MRRLALFVLLVLTAAPASAQDREVVATTLAVGSSPASPSGTSVNVSGLASSGTGLPLFTESDGDMFRRALGKSDLPGTVGYTDEAETWSLLQTFTSGLTSNGLVTIGGSNDLLLGTGGMRVASGCINLRNIADSATIAAFCDGSVALNQNTAVTGTFSASGAATLSSTLGVTGATTLSSTLGVTGAATFSSTVGISGLTTAALIKTTGVYGVSEPFTVYATDGTTARLQVANAGKATLSDTGTDSYLQYTASGASSGSRQWRAGVVGGNWLLQGGNDAGASWANLFRGTQASGVPDGMYLGEDVSLVGFDRGYQTNLGELNRKGKALHFAELWVETLVAQNTIATIGGRILVGPTTKLEADIDTDDTTITVEHNEMAVGDIAYMEANGKVEFVEVTAGPVAAGGGGSAIEFIGSEAVNANTITIPTHEAGDLLVIVALRNGSTTPPTLPGGWDAPAACTGAGGNSTAYRVGYKVAASSGETSGTWTNGHHLIAHVYRGATGIGACTATSQASSSTIPYPGITLTETDGTSWLMAFGFSSSTASDVDAAVPSGYTFRDSIGTGPESASFDRAGVTASPSQEDVAVSGSGNTRGIRIEILGDALPTTGPYEYTVTRDLDGTGGNDWFAGDAIFNTGTTGNGFIDLYSVAGVKNGATELGPTIAGNVRLSDTYNDWGTRWAIGNLRGLYTYGATDIYGAAFGDASDVWGGFDATNGIRFFEGGTNLKLQVHPSGYVQIGETGSGQANTLIDNTALKLRRGTVDYVTLSSSGLVMSDGTNTRVALNATDGLLLGVTASGQGNILADTSGNLLFRSGTVERIRVNATNGSVTIFDDDGATARVNISATVADFGTTAAHRFSVNYADGTLRAYDSASKQYFQLDATNGVRVGDWYTAGGAYLQATATALNFCNASGGCPLTFDGATGDITSTGDLSIEGSASVAGSGTFAASGITLDTDGITAAIGASSTMVTGQAYKFDYSTNGMTFGGMYGYATATTNVLRQSMTGSSASDDYLIELVTSNAGSGGVGVGGSSLLLYGGPTYTGRALISASSSGASNSLDIRPTSVLIDGNTTFSGTCTGLPTVVFGMIVSC